MGVITSLWLFERRISTEPTGKKWRHTWGNFLFVASALPIQLAISVVLIAVSGWTQVHHWGLAYLLPDALGPWARYLFMFMVLDLLAYVYHVLMHRIALFWRFHLVHHTDGTVDVSTTVREHPGETFLRNCIELLFAFLCGASFWVLMLRQSVQSVSNIIAHTSCRFSPRLARILGWVFITPNLHHVHHHYRLPYTNCNYGDVLSIWDRLFGTYTELAAEDTRFGLDTHMHARSGVSYGDMMKMPFQKPGAHGKKQPPAPG